MAVDEFESSRQTLETRNELMINTLRGTLLLLGAIWHTVNHIRPVGPFRSPLRMVVLLGILGLLCVGLHVYLRRGPRYIWWRKYALTQFEGLLPLIGVLVMRGQAPPSVLVWVSLGISTLMVVFSGLRYSVGAVIHAGLNAIFWYLLVMVPIGLPVLGWLPAVGMPALTVGVCIVLGYMVSSLSKLHRDSIWKKRLARFLAPELVEELARKPQVLEQQIENRRATVLFTDIRGFTTLSEQLSPQQVVGFLNQFLEEMTLAIMAHQGMLDKYMGDAVMAVFGVPLECSDHARRAVNAGQEMIRRLERLNETLTQQGLPRLGIGVGIHTGDLVVGAIGSSRRLEYTVIGDSVNLAARLEGLTRQYPVDILLSGCTRGELGEAPELEQIDTVQVKGRDQPVAIWSFRETNG